MDTTSSINAATLAYKNEAIESTVHVLNKANPNYKFARILDSAEPSTVWFRIANLGSTGWTPQVKEFWMKDANGSKVVDANLICSGFWKSEYECQNAVDMVAPWWRPQCRPCEQADAWIGFEVNSNVEVSSAYAKGLGLGA